MDYKKQVCELIKIRSELDKTRQELFTKFPQMDKKRDARLTFFNRAASILDTSAIELMMSESVLQNPRSWSNFAKKYSFNKPPSKSILPMTLSYEQSVVFGYLLFLFSSYETSLRRIVRTIDPSRYQLMINSIDNIFNWYVGRLKFSKIERKRYCKLMEIYRLIRNSIHNNGVYSPNSSGVKSGSRKQRTWKGVKVIFTVDRLIRSENFWALVAVVTPDMVEMMKILVTKTTQLYVKQEKLIEDNSVSKRLLKYYHP